jgi:aryl-alcohol dehydrogenase-like predicted oxidoreductase
MWNAAMSDFERDIVLMCRDEGMGLCPYRVLNQGRFQTEARFTEREKKNDGRNFVPFSEHDKKVSRVLEDVANAEGAELLQVSQAYVLYKTPYVFPIVGTRKVGHLKGVIPALGISLTTTEIEKIESAYTFNPGFPHTFLSGTLFSSNPPKAPWL